MRSTQKKGPRTRGLKLARLSCAAAATYTATVNAYRARLNAETLSESVRPPLVLKTGLRADARSTEQPGHGLISVFGGSMAATQNNTNKPPPVSGGAEACKEIPMPTIAPDELQRQRHEIARMAAEAAGRVASHIPYDRQAGSRLVGGAPSAAFAGKAVADAYQAALKQLSSSAEPDPATAESGS